MKKLIISLVVLSACQTTVSTSTTRGTAATPAKAPEPVMSVASTSASFGQSGAADAISAVRGFMAAAKGSDLRAFGALWGDQQGPAHDKMPREEFEKREIVLMRCLRHDRYEIAGEAPALNGSRAVVLNLNYGELSRSADLQVVRGPSDRWYIQDVNLQKLQDICMSRG